MELNTQNVGDYEFAANGSSTDVNALGMREMQAMAFEKRFAQKLLIKAPPACGKSRALMFLGLDKLLNQGIEKVIVAVPQKAIGSSFKNTRLEKFGTDWEVNPYYDLCTDECNDTGKANRLHKLFKDPQNNIAVCAHPTLIKFYKELSDKSLLNKTLIAIDEFHHVSAAEGNQLGGVVHSLMHDTSAHIIAMTGSYFRGDRIAVLEPEDEAKFEQVIYTYYQQLNGYRFLKNLRLEYVFYEDNWLDELDKMLSPAHSEPDYSDLNLNDFFNENSPCFDKDFNKPRIEAKTIIYIPKVNSMASTGDKRNEFLRVCEILGHNPEQTFVIDNQTGFYHIQTRYGKTLKVANLIYEQTQEKTIQSLRKVSSRDDVDIIIALDMAKEGFDWPWCEHVIVAGFRKSLTEMIQVLGRTTRDCEGKKIAKYTNMIKAPAASQDDMMSAVDDLLKAISLSLMMERVLQPNIRFIPRSSFSSDESNPNISNIIVNDDEFSPKVQEFFKKDKDGSLANDLLSQLYANSDCQKNSFLASVSNDEVLSSDLIDLQNFGYLSNKLPLEGWDKSDYISLSKALRALAAELHKRATNKETKSQKATFEDQQGFEQRYSRDFAVHDEISVTQAGQNVLETTRKFIDVSTLDITLIDTCNAFGRSYDILSKVLDARTLKAVLKYSRQANTKVTEEEACQLMSSVETFMDKYKRKPSLTSTNPFEVKLAAALKFIENVNRRINASKNS